MTERETKQILAVLQTAYPHFYRGETTESLTRAVRLWAAMFAEDDYQTVSAAVSALIATRAETYPPNIGQVKQKMFDVTHTNERTGTEAWAIVRKAVSRSGYYAAEEWAKLPGDIRACVRPEQLRAWAVDEDFNEPVIMSHFIRAYRERAQRDRDYQLMPPSAKAALEQRQRDQLPERREDAGRALPGG